MVFDARAEAELAEGEYPPLEFVSMDGQPMVMVHPGLVSAADYNRLVQAERAMSGDGDTDTDVLVRRHEVMTRIFGDDVALAIDEMPVVVQGRLMRSWYDLGNTMAGDSSTQQEPSAPNRAARRSKRTSPPKASTSGSSRSAKSKALPAAS